MIEIVWRANAKRSSAIALQGGDSIYSDKITTLN